MLKLLWCLFSNSHSLWVHWVRKYLIRDEVLWDVKDTGLGSWVWWKLLSVRQLPKNFLRMEIKDGSLVRFWTDIWHPKGRLIELTGEIGTQKVGIRRDTTINDIYVDGRWRFRRCQDPLIQGMIQDVERFPLTLSSGRDEALRRRGTDDYISRFIASETC
ncbi:hypothetical protein Bca4012_010874 [Brassica carinata]|uniref:Uncharacterized protein n=1 Tax=Brassica carinata TaxID=52824 RepID=A0A8X7S3F7_BRACI|nr:hypothetical protein Bca52824_035772 [Brassica carinata]